MKIFRLALISLLILGACNGPVATVETPSPQDTPQPTSTLSPSDTAVPTALVSPTTSGLATLHIWLPPQFDPAAGTPAGDLLQAQLDEFSKRRPGVHVVVRIKALAGPGGLLDSLTTTSAAAPLALPDLIALPRELLEAAALKGLLAPYDNLTTTLDGQDWFEYAQQLARLQDSVYGLPFAGDALALVYRADVVATPPTDWPASLNLEAPLVFPAADPQALFTMALYQANGGDVRDDQGRPFLDAVILSQVLTYYMEAEEVGVTPFWLTQYQSDDQVWDAFLENQADLVATWSSRYLSASNTEALNGDGLPDNFALAPIPTPDGEPYTLATGWVWGLATNRAEQQGLSVELAEFLTSSGFLARWTEALGYLPPRPSSLSAWSDDSSQAIINHISLSAGLYPSADILTSLGTPLQQVTVQVLKQQNDPVTAAQDAVTSLSAP